MNQAFIHFLTRWPFNRVGDRSKNAGDQILKFCSKGTETTGRYHFGILLIEHTYFQKICIQLEYKNTNTKHPINSDN